MIGSSTTACLVVFLLLFLTMQPLWECPLKDLAKKKPGSWLLQYRISETYKERGLISEDVNGDAFPMSAKMRLFKSKRNGR